MKDTSIFQEETEVEDEKVETIDVKIESKFKNTFKNIRILLFLGVVLSNIIMTGTLIIYYNHAFIIFALNVYFLLKYYKLVKSGSNV